MAEVTDIDITCADSIIIIPLDSTTLDFLKLYYIFFALNKCVKKMFMALKELEKR